MAKQEVDIGIEGNDNTGDSIRESFRKVNENFSELYAVFGIGGQISFTDLSDVPNTYIDQENKIPVVKENATGLNFLELASDSDANPNDVDTIVFDYSVEGKLIVKVGSTSIKNDPFPALGGPLNANEKPIGNLADISQASVDNFNSIHGTNIQIGDLVIDKAYGDANYQEKQRAGSGIRLNPEPVDTSDYIKTINSFDSFGDAVITDHEYGDEFLGAPFIFNTTGTPPTNLVDGQRIYIRIKDQDTISFHTTEEGANNNTSRIIMSGGTGTLTITDADYDETLDGNWLSTVALPRESVTRRQGDRMEGTLFLNDHPGDLAGLGTDIGGSDDLQAATKLYVDRGTPTSQVNLYVSTDGDDAQRFTPAGKEGRSASWAYASVKAACEKAEEIIESSPFETGPYRQTMQFGGGRDTAKISTAGVASPPAGRNNYSTLITENVEFIKAEVIAFIAATYPDFEYDEDTCARDVEYIVNSVRLDILLGNNANYLSRWAGIRYYSNPSARKAIGEQKTETVAGIQHTQKLVRDIVKGNAVGGVNSVAGTLYQTRETQYLNAALNPDPAVSETVADATDAKFTIVLGVIETGPLDAPTIVDGGTTYKLNVGNGNFGFIDQGDPNNTDIIPGKVIIGKNSGARARIIKYTYESDPLTSVSTPETDEFEVQLLEPIEFENGEELEYGNLVRETQISIRVESGIYYEDYPIRVPTNVSIKGDEFRRVIIRPKQRVSQSRYTNTFFYRDAEFDGLVPVSSRILQLSVRNGAPDGTRAAAAGDYTNVEQTTTTTVDPITSEVTVLEGTSGVGKNAIFDITVNDDGSIVASGVTIVDGGTSYLVGDTITISDDDIGLTGADDITLVVEEISGGKPYINPLTKNIDGYFGYHYLLDPNRPRSLLLTGYANNDRRPIAAKVMADNREFIQEQVTEYIDINFPAVVYNRSKCFRDVGLIVDAMAADFEVSGLENILEAQGEYYFGSLPKDGSQTAATIAGIEWIHTIATDILVGQQPSIIWGTGLDNPQADLFNGEAEAGSVALSNNFIETINYAFNENYNPPLRNDEMDAFLMNDAALLRNMTVQGHGGFMLVLDPYGQVLTKSPYIQTGSSFSRSQNKQVFSGGMFVDAFTGNSAMNVIGKDDAFTLNVKSFGSQDDPQGLFIRRPQTPCPFYVDGRRFQVNAIKNYDPDEGTATLLLDRNSNEGNGFTGITSTLATGVDLDSVADFEFNQEKCERDTGLILDAVGLDIITGSNYQSVTAGLAYQRANADVVTAEQLAQTTNAINFAKSEVLALTDVDASVTAETRATAAFDEIVDILNNGVVSTDAAADALTFPAPAALPTANADDANVILQANRAFIISEVTAFISANYPALTYDSTKCERDVGYIVDALSFDVLYGGNSATLINARSYFVGTQGQLGDTDEETATVAAYTELQTIVSQVVQGTRPSQPVTASPATGTEGTIVSDLVGIIKDAIDAGTVELLPTLENPDATALSVPAALIAAQTDITDNRALVIARTIQSIDAALPITLQTGGNRSILGNDFTQVNDQGYGLVVVNGALSEMVSMFTYYCFASYYARNGSEIRSLGGSSCYGEYGLVAEGSDPNEIPDSVVLRDDMVNPAKAFTADVVLTTSNPITVVAGETLTQAGTGATGVVTMSTNTRTVYLTSVADIFNTTGQLTGSTSGALGADSIPGEVDTTGYANDEEQLFANIYDFEFLPSNRGEFDVYHPNKDIFARYEIANVVDTGLKVGETKGFGDTITYTYNAVLLGAGTGATFNVSKTITDGYSVTPVLKGEDYEVGDEIVLSGTDLGGASPANDVTLEVTEIDSNGGINEFTTSGTIAITADTPRYDGRVIKTNFATGDAQFSQDGLLETGGILHNTYVQVRANQTFILEDIARPDILTIRPSTAVIFRENPEYVYRSISFLTADALGNELPSTNSLAGFDSTYDYVRLVVDTVNAQNTVGTVLDLASNPLTGGTTLGDTAGDTVVAVTRIFEANEIRRLNNNLLTEEDFRPLDFDGNGELAMITAWDGKKHTVSNYRGVKIDPVSGDHEIQASPSETDDYGIVDIGDVSDIQYPARAAGLGSTLVVGTVSPILRAGLQDGSPGTVTIAISTCRATAHDFLDVGTGGFNTSNYPNVIFGLPRAPNQSNEVDERGKGRVFYVSTDQNGIFRVGRFFSVDQGTGTVSFSASIALSDVDGLGFKRGVVVTEFSTDTAMTDNASDTVPTESAVRGYVNRRLGFDQTGAAISNKIGPGVLAPNGSVPMTADLNAAGNQITSLGVPTADSDAATKSYVDDSRGDNDTIPDLRDTEVNDYAEGQLLVSTGEKKLVILAGTIVDGPFLPGQTITGSLSGAEGTIVDVVSKTGVEGNIVELTYTPVSGEFSSGPPTGQDVVSVTGAAEGTAVDGPVDVWGNGVYSSDSDIEITTNRIVTTDGGGNPTDRYTEVSVQIVAGTIVNADVSATAGIVQSKLDLNSATTRANATGITQADLGVASFDNTRFTATNGWIQIAGNGIRLGDIQTLLPGTVIGNSTASAATPAAVPFATVVTEGGGLADTDFEAASEVAESSDPGQSLVKTGAGTYGISNITKTGEPNSIIKTDASGSIQVNSLILGGDSNYEILSLDTTELLFKTPGQGTILSASGGSPGTGGSPSDPGYIAPTFPDIEIPGSVNISGTGVTESFLQQSSPLNGEKVLAVDWIYSSFIEAPGEKGNASSGLSIGANTGKTTAGQVGIIVADSATNSSVAPFVFSSSGVIPDTNNVYNIGNSTRRYNTVYATVFNGTATEAFYADLAENYLGDTSYEPGTVLVFGGDAEVTVTDIKGNRKVAGVVTTNPAHLMNSHLKGDNVVGLALQGRVPCKVLGRVEKGDILVTSAIPGYAIVDNDPKVGTVIGKALENKDDTGKGIIEVVVGKH